MPAAQALEATYLDSNAYHTSMHAADVVQTLAVLLLAEHGAEAGPGRDPTHGHGSLRATLRAEEKLALIIAAAMHDAGHPGMCSAVQ